MLVKLVVLRQFNLLPHSDADREISSRTAWYQVLPIGTDFVMFRGILRPHDDVNRLATTYLEQG
jgi:hypothetical protein